MQIVINIPEKTVNEIKDNVMFADTIPSEILWDVTGAIVNGTPIPKGHGDLMDRDKIDWYGCTTEEDCPYKDRDCKDCMRAECYKPQVDALPTIIEADKE